MHNGAYRDSGMYTFTHCNIGSNIGHVSCFDCVGLAVVPRLVWLVLVWLVLVWCCARWLWVLSSRVWVGVGSAPLLKGNSYEF